MKASLFCNVAYVGKTPHDVWPLSGEHYSSELAVRSMETAFNQLRCADEFGFDAVTVAEHHYTNISMTPNPFVIAGAACQFVRRAKIAVLGPTIPILNPVRVAEEFAMIDTMSNGRLIAGLMRGTPNEYVTYNINPSESRERFAEATHLIRRAWAERQPFGWLGKYYQYQTISIWPKPVQNPVPLFMSAASPEAGEFAAANRIGAGFAFTTVPIAKKAVAHYRACAQAAGWEPTADNIMYRTQFHVADTDQQAFDDLNAIPPRVNLADQNKAISQALRESGYYGKDIVGQTTRNARRELAERIELGQLIVGSPDTALKQAQRIRDELGAGMIDLGIGMDLGAKTMRSIELFATKVLPRLKQL